METSLAGADTNINLRLRLTSDSGSILRARAGKHFLSLALHDGTLEVRTGLNVFFRKVTGVNKLISETRVSKSEGINIRGVRRNEVSVLF